MTRKSEAEAMHGTILCFYTCQSSTLVEKFKVTDWQVYLLGYSVFHFSNSACFIFSLEKKTQLFCGIFVEQKQYNIIVHCLKRIFNSIVIFIIIFLIKNFENILFMSMVRSCFKKHFSKYKC